MITERLHARAAEHADRVFVVTDRGDLTYGEMSRLVRLYAAKLAERVRPGQSVALLCGNRPAFLIAWFALSDIGAITVPLNAGLVGDGLRYTLEQSGAVMLLIEPDLFNTLQSTLIGFGSELPIELLDESVEVSPSEARATVPPLRFENDAPNSILYTSGTTGSPKGAVLSHGAYRLAGIDMVQSLGLTQDDRILVFLPLFHANPQMYAVMPALEVGATIILLSRFSAGGFFEAAERHRATGFTYVGTVLSILVKRHETAQRGHGLRWCVGGGAPAEIWRAVEDRFGVAVRELYGMTETGGWVSMNTATATRLGSVGTPRKGVEIAIKSEAGVSPTNERGEIVVRAADPLTFFKEYWNNSQATAATLQDGWLHTGDRGWCDADGFLFFDGRLKDLIRRGGEMIAPAEIELQLLKHPSIRECAVFAAPDDIMGEEVAAAVVADQPIAAGDLRHFLTGRVPQHMLPRFIAFTNALPKTETEKIKRHELNRLLTTAIDLGNPETAHTV
jgi:acyl-CoA synthetase (AMP-forming)/AMP-acid ligase II